MSAPSNGSPFPAETQGIATEAIPVTRPMYWSVRRELWENRFLYIGPLTVAVVAFIAFTFSTIGMPARRRAVLLLDPAQQRAKIGAPYDVIATVLLLAALAIGAYYCIEALHGERRDRSILFWKSLPVSDRTTVLSKALIPLLILPLLTFAIVFLTHFLMLLHTSVVLLRSGLAGTTWTRFNLLEQSLILLYAVIVLPLWHAPIYGWLLLVSASARRAALLWALLPLFAATVIEKLALNTQYVSRFLISRLLGGIGRAFAFNAMGAVTSLTQLTPGRFFSTPGLWIGLAFAAVFLAAAVRLRRNREPI